MTTRLSPEILDEDDGRSTTWLPCLVGGLLILFMGLVSTYAADAALTQPVSFTSASQN
jgi:hypothetical protein